MINKFKNIFILIVLIILLIFFILNPTLVINNITKNTNSFMNNVFPSLFLFFLLIDLLLAFNFITVLKKLFAFPVKKLFHLDINSSFILFISLFSGFPSGSKYITNLLNKKMISIESANTLVTYTHFGNIAFILGTIGPILNKKITLIILICHYLSNLIIAFIIRPKEVIKEKEVDKQASASFTDILSTSIISNTKIIIIIFGTMIFFSTISLIISATIPINSYQSTLLCGILDLSSGIISLNNLSIPLFYKGLLSLIFISFGSLSVHMQVRILLRNTKIKYSYFLLGRISQTALSITLFLLVYWRFY
ncbi:MAG: hypothetical protein IJH13_02435 [Bacilli bacterium]|nr:hypothetical protein [Bacilli bacterium]